MEGGTEDPVYSIPNLSKIITSILQEIIDEDVKSCKYNYITKY